jgi:hypothetical protein
VDLLRKHNRPARLKTALLESARLGHIRKA